MDKNGTVKTGPEDEENSNESRFSPPEIEYASPVYEQSRRRKGGEKLMGHVQRRMFKDSNLPEGEQQKGPPHRLNIEDGKNQTENHQHTTIRNE